MQTNKLRIRDFMAILVMFLFSTSLYAQQKTLTGTVIESNGDPIIGASVMVKGTTQGTTTNFDGKFTLNVNNDAKILIFRSVGKETKEISITGNVYNVTLVDNQKVLDEVVVIGYGTIKRKDLVASVSSVDEKALKDIPVSSVSEALTGKLPGVQVTTTEGSPDAEIKIRVRGGGSITQSNTPLYIVDGFAKDNIKDIPPSDIASVDVLKDASSTAIYGSRGANGVILITTKSAQEGKLTVSYNTYSGFKKMTKMLDVLSPYGFARSQYERASWGGASKVTSEYENYFGSYDDINLYNYVTPTNWQKETFGRIGITQNHSLTLTGGNKKFSYSANGSYVYDKAIMYMSDYNRSNLGLKLKYNPLKWLKADFAARYAYTTINGSGANDQTGMEKSTSDSRVKSALVYTPIPLKNIVSQDDDADATASLYSPLVSTEDNNRVQHNKDYSINGGLTFSINKNISFNTTFGYSASVKNDNKFFGLTSYYVREGGALKGSDNLPAPVVFIINTNRTTLQNTNVLTYKKDDFIKGHNINAVLGQETLIRPEQRLTSDYEKFPSNYNSYQTWANLSDDYMRAPYPINFVEPDYRLFSYFGRINYDYEGKYLVAATLRADGSSKFSSGNQWGFFPAISAGWRISDEKFMKSTEKWLSNLKLRGGYGEAGNDNITNSAFIRSYSLSQAAAYLDPALFSSIGYTGTTLANPNLKWETTVTQNLGLDFGFFKNRINGSLELYSNKTLDALMKVTLGGVGYADQWQNAASTSNKGAELTLNAQIIDTKDFDLNCTFNISANKNTVLALKNGVQSTFNEGWTNLTNAMNSYIVTVGQPVGIIYGYENDGWYSANDFKWNGSAWKPNPDIYTYDATTKTYSDKDGNKFADNSGITGLSWGPGAMKLKDTNKDGVIDLNDRVKIGNTNPKHFGSFAINATYKGLDLMANFNWVYGNQIYNATKIEVSSAYYKYRNSLKTSDVAYTQIDWNTGQRITDTAVLTEMNSGATTWAAPTGGYALTSWAIEDGSFLRFNNLTIGYTFPKKLTREQKLRVYLSGYNLFCWTKYSGYDPEVDTRRTTPATPGVDYSAYPKSRSFNIGLNMTF